MKAYVFSIVMNILIVTSISGKIKNGYEPDINVAREGLKKINLLMDSTITPVERRRLIEHATRLREFILYHDLTDRLLFQFKLISPDIYNEIDTIRDAQARLVDVYVKFLPNTRMRGNMAGTTNVPLGEDGDTYSSYFGPQSVSTTITSENNALSLLAHEFGHIKYQVPNIATYRKFYTRHYHVVSVDSPGYGHHHMDPGGQIASEFERQFRLNHDGYLKNNGEKRQRLTSLIKSMEKSLPPLIMN